MDFHFWIVPLILIIVHFLFLLGAWRLFRRIPERRFTPWFLPSDGEEIELPLMQHMRIRLWVRMLRSDAKDKRVMISIPPRLTIGELFRYFAFQRRKFDPSVVEYQDKQARSYGWEFYARKWGGLGKRVLDPGKSLIENRLESYAIIVVKRIPPHQ